MLSTLGLTHTHTAPENSSLTKDYCYNWKTKLSARTSKQIDTYTHIHTHAHIHSSKEKSNTTFDKYFWICGIFSIVVEMWSMLLGIQLYMSQYFDHVSFCKRFEKLSLLLLLRGRRGWIIPIYKSHTSGSVI